MLKINEYEFEDHPEYDVQLHAVRFNRIIGSVIANRTVQPFTVNLKGLPVINNIQLTPYDKHKDLKKAHSEGAIIEYNNPIGWHHTLAPSWGTYEYRIKGGISIESWNKHKDLIIQWWNGVEIQTYTHVNMGFGKWKDIDKFDITYKYYRVKPKPINIYKDVVKMTDGKHCCWVHEDGGYFAYCHKDGRPLTRTGYGVESCRTWSTVGVEVLDRNNLLEG